MNYNYIICPECNRKDAYFNGSKYYCPACDYEWLHNSSTEPETYPGISDFEKLAALAAPFFKLEHGKLYDCMNLFVGHGSMPDSIIPLAFEKGRNRQFVMIDARKFLQKNPDYVRNTIKMDFDEIMSDIRRNDYLFKHELCIMLCVTQSDRTLLLLQPDEEVVFCSFSITDEI